MTPGWAWLATGFAAGVAAKFAALAIVFVSRCEPE